MIPSEHLHQVYSHLSWLCIRSHLFSPHNVVSFRKTPVLPITLLRSHKSFSCWPPTIIGKYPYRKDFFDCHQSCNNFCPNVISLHLILPSEPVLNTAEPLKGARITVPPLLSRQDRRTLAFSLPPGWEFLVLPAHCNHLSSLESLLSLRSAFRMAYVNYLWRPTGIDVFVKLHRNETVRVETCHVSAPLPRVTSRGQRAGFYGSGLDFGKRLTADSVHELPA